MTDDFPQAVMLVSQNATKRVMVVLPMFNVDKNNKNHGMSPMFIELRSSVGKSVSAAEVTSDFTTNASANCKAATTLFHDQRANRTISFLNGLNFSFVTGYIPRHEQFSKSAVQIQPSPLAMVNGQRSTLHVHWDQPQVAPVLDQIQSENS